MRVVKSYDATIKPFGLSSTNWLFLGEKYSIIVFPKIRFKKT